MAAGDATEVKQEPPKHPFRRIETPDGVLVVIDGAQHPEAVPESSVWGGFFVNVDRARKENDQDFLRYLGVLDLSDDDAAILYREAEAQPARDASCRARRAVLDERMKPNGSEERDEKAYSKAALELMIECRTEILAAADRVMATVSPGGVKVIEKQIAESTRRSVVTFWEINLSTYKLPR